MVRSFLKHYVTYIIDAKLFVRVKQVLLLISRFPKSIINCLLYQAYLHQPNLLSISMQEMLTKESSDRILQGERSSVCKVLIFIYINIFLHLTSSLHCSD